MKRAAAATLGSSIVAPPEILWLGHWVLLFAGTRAEEAARAYAAAARRDQTILTAAPGVDIARALWPVAQRCVCICDTGGADSDEFSRALVRSHARKVGLLRLDLAAPWWARRLAAQAQLKLPLSEARVK